MLFLLNYALPIMRYIPVPQVPQVPFIALRPFFIVTSSPLPISLLALHFTQYPSMHSYRPEPIINAAVVGDSI